MSSPPRTRLSDLDPALGPIRRRATTPQRLTLAYLCRALSDGIPASRVRLWMASRDPDTLAAVGTGWPALVTRAQARTGFASAAAAPGPARSGLLYNLGTRLLVHTLAPAPATDRDGEAIAAGHTRIANARGLLASEGAGLLRQCAWPRPGQRPMDTMLWTDANVGMRLGISRQAARTTRLLAERLGWLSPVVTVPGAASRYRLGRVAGEGARAWAAALDDSILAVVEYLEGDGSTPPVGRDVAALLAADHPVWGYGPPREKGGGPTEPERGTWLVLMADAVVLEAGVDLDPTRTWGIGPQTVAAHRRVIERYGLLEPGLDLAARLVEVGQANGALDRAAQARATRRAEAAAQTARILAHRERKQVAVALVRDALPAVQSQAGVQVVAPDDAERKGIWARAMHAELASRVAPDHVGEVRAEVVRRLVREGHERDAARTIAARIVPDPDPHIGEVAAA